MKPPKTVKVGNCKFDIAFVDQEGDDWAGKCYAVKGLLCVLRDCAPGYERDTVFHECGHAVWESRGLRDKEITSEEVIGQFLPGILQLLRDNPRLVDYLLEKD